LERKNKHVLIRKFNITSNEKNYHRSTFIQYIKSIINLFSLYRMKKKLNKRIEKKSKEIKKTKLEIFSGSARPYNIGSSCKLDLTILFN